MKKRIIMPDHYRGDTFKFESIHNSTIIGIVVEEDNKTKNKSVVIKSDNGYTCLTIDLDITNNRCEETKTGCITTLIRTGALVESFVFDSNREALIWLAEK